MSEKLEAELAQCKQAMVILAKQGDFSLCPLRNTSNWPCYGCKHRFDEKACVQARIDQAMKAAQEETP